MAYTRRSFLKGLSGSALAVAAGRTAGAARRERRPNVVLVVSDELGYYELSCMGHPHFYTPNVDRMAAEGTRFTQALAGSAVCAPTRCCLMTGKHAGHTSVRVNGGGTPLRAGEETVASVLKKAGYATGGFGKWGCGGRGSTGVPEEHGFDVFLGYYDQVHAHTYYPAYLLRNSEEIPLAGNAGGDSGPTYSHYVIWEAGMDFIRQNRTRPFFCYLPITPPHGMFSIPDDDPAWQRVKDETWPEPARRYSAMVGMVDRQMGELFDLLRSLKLEDDTIVFFSGDNGGMDYFRDKDHPRGFHGPNVNPKTGVAFRGQKGNLYEGGLRIPMIVRWPGTIEPGRVSDLLWYFPDVLPTLAELAGAEPPADIDGISIVPELLGAQAAGRPQPAREFLYWEIGGQTAVRMGSWKAIRPKPKADWELYDLAADIGEETDVAAAHADVLAAMTAFAESAHVPAVEGTFHDPAIHERDRQAKFRDSRFMPPVYTISREGLVPPEDVRIVQASSESAFNGKLAACAIDGDPNTIWHTAWQQGAVPHPHELVLDLGREYAVRGFRYLARQDNGWNGTIAECELSVGPAPDRIPEAGAKARLAKTKKEQEVTFAPMRGRFVRFRALSEIAGGPWASIAELGILGD